MSETPDEQPDAKKEKKPLTLARPGRLELKKTVEGGQIRQAFSHGRTKAVKVEVKKKRTYTQGDSGAMTEVKEGLLPQVPGVSVDDIFKPAKPSGVAADALRELTEEEKATRARALEGAIRAEATADATAEATAEATALKELEEDLKIAEEPAQVAEEPTADAAEAPEVTEPEEDKPASPAAAPAEKAKTPVQIKPAEPSPALEDEDGERGKAGDRRGRKPGRGDNRRPSLSLRKDAARRRPGKMTVTRALDDESEERVRSLASVRRAREREKRAQQQLASGEPLKVVRDVVIPETITVQELSNRMAERAVDVIKALMNTGTMATINQVLDADTAELVAGEFGHNVKRVSEADVEIGLKGSDDADASLEDRAPVVTVMGHVDHGKTSLLDALRKTNVVGGEAGGITQHIGAYQVKLASGANITFLDTPGHEAFTAMRSRGAKVTDIVVLVVAADDGIMPQTIEAIHHSKAAEVPLIIAINKIDIPNADTDRIRRDLLQQDIAVETMGGDVLTVEVSAKEGTNLDKLEEAILLQAEILELKANPNRSADGIVVEARIERGRGNVATVLVQRGTLKVGDIFVAGSEWGRVRALLDDRGRELDQAGPSIPVEVLGLNGTPLAGDEFAVVEDEARARQITEFRLRRARDAMAAAGARGTVEQMLSDIAAGQAKELPLVVKADVHGSLEAILGSLEKMSTDEVAVQILHSAVGGINESDVTLAQASKAWILGFNVRANPQARELASQSNTDIRYYSIIYDLTNDVKAALSGMLSPTMKETMLGNAQIREVFNVSKVGKIAGCMITDGTVKRGAKVRLIRDSVVIHEGALKTLKRFKDEVRDVKEGYECGMAFENYQDIQTGDVIECFEVEEIARTL